MKNIFKLSLITLMALVTVAASSNLASAAGFAQQNNIISAPVFDNVNSMSAAQIDNFLNGFSGSCISPNSGFKAIDPTGYNPNNGFLYGGFVTAGQVIYSASQAYGINPQVLLTTLEKEQSLVTGQNNFNGYCNNGDQHKYAAAVGYGCPDSPTKFSYTGLNLYQRNGVTVTAVSPTCVNSSLKAGFSQQVVRGAWLLKFGEQRSQGNTGWAVVKGSWNNSDDPQSCYGGPMTQGTWVRCPSGSAAYYDGYTTIDGVAVHMDAGPTAALYWYTPHFGGNINFYGIFTNWFGSTQTTVPYAWLYAGQQAYSDAAMTKPLTGTTTVAPGAKIYATVTAYNNGNQAWQQSNLHLATSNPNDRSSAFYDPSWLAPQRPASMQQASVAPGSSATFNFVMKAPLTIGSYRESFNLVADGIAWLNDPGMYFTINTATAAPVSNSQNVSLLTNQTLTTGQYLLSPDRQSVLSLQSDGNLVLYVNFVPVWSSWTPGTKANKLVMQGDGNLVLYNPAGAAVWASWTGGNSGSTLQTQIDGNLVLYSSSNAPLWSTGTTVNPTNLAYVNSSLTSGTMLFAGQHIETLNRTYDAVLQSDGNFVVYKNSVPVWASWTGGTRASRLVMQPDGNLVLYNPAGAAVWASWTPGRGPSSIYIQSDGNLAIYNAQGQPTWNIGTH